MAHPSSFSSWQHLSLTPLEQKRQELRELYHSLDKEQLILEKKKREIQIHMDKITDELATLKEYMCYLLPSTTAEAHILLQLKGRTSLSALNEMDKVQPIRFLQL
jgi:wobble nucleotide-excising tRNase